MQDAGQFYYLTFYNDKGLFVYFKTSRRKFETFKGMKRRITRFNEKNYKDFIWRFSTHYERDLIIEGRVPCENLC